MEALKFVFHTLMIASAAIYIGRRSPAFPVTPPGVRVRTGRFGGLSDRTVNLGIPVGGRGLGAVLRKALAKDREARYGTMREFAEDLRRLDPHQSNALLTPPANRNRTFFGRHANKKWYLAAALAGIAAYVWIAGRVPPPTGELQLVPLTTFAGSKTFRVFLRTVLGLPSPGSPPGIVRSIYT